MFFKKILMKAMFTPTAFEIVMSEGRSVLTPAQWGTGSEKVKSKISELLELKPML